MYPSTIKSQLLLILNNNALLYITAVLSQFAAFARRDMTLVPGNHDPEVDVIGLTYYSNDIT
jgi:hypothetical protein